MSSHLIDLLKEWHPLRDATDWVLGTIYQTEGPAYRKAGAMMLFSADGHQLGMLSGGCLESDIHRHARRVMLSQQAKTLSYDGTDEDDLSFRLGIGCGGTVRILLQPICRDNSYLELERLYSTLREYRTGHYLQRISADGEVAARFLAESEIAGGSCSDQKAGLLDEGGEQWLHTSVTPPAHLLVIGGGIDARPLAAMGHQLGWRVSVWDQRPANARPEYFPLVDQLMSGSESVLSGYVRTHRVNAAVLMSHSIPLDARALAALQGTGLEYLAMLGPESRRDRVLTEAGIELNRCTPPLAGPAGLDIGAELPETIALAILAECQAALKQRSGRSLSGILEIAETPS
jgi:xanthine dehydrogenase accessory factor